MITQDTPVSENPRSVLIEGSAEATTVTSKTTTNWAVHNTASAVVLPVKRLMLETLAPAAEARNW